VERRLKHWGWGYEDEHPAPGELRATAAFLAQRLGFGSADPAAAVAIEDAVLPPVRLRAPASLAGLCTEDPHERARHAYGRSYRDVVRAFQGRFECAPDIVARPRDEAEITALLEWAIQAGAAVIPFGGGTSVVGGVEPRVDPSATPACSRSTSPHLTGCSRSIASRSRPGSRPARGGRCSRISCVGTGSRCVTTPSHFSSPTLGGWIATRAGGHFSTLDTHIDDLVESVRAITPAGPWGSRRLPGSGAGVSPDRMLLGSEGTLGIITEAWVRVRPRPRHRSSAGVRFPQFSAGAEAVRALAQSGLNPAACRLVDPSEAALTGAGDGSYALLVLGFESASVPTEPWLTAALELCAEHGGAAEQPTPSGADSTTTWRDAFLRAPYLRDTFVAMGVLSETFETAITWERLPTFHRAVLRATSDAVRDVCGAGSVTCRLTHVYPNGPAPYYTVLAPARRGEELTQWAAIKTAASEAILSHGGTITHHHAVGRDHRPWYDRQRPEAFALAMRGAKAALDPSGALNPGVLLDP